MLVAAALAGSGYAVWRKYGQQVLASSHFRLSPEHVTITPLPEWIHADIKSDALRDAGLDSGATILDDELAQQVARAFALHPWVAKVERVTKRAGPRIDVELVYRRPVCMVDVPGGVYPVDAEGIVLPRDDFSVNDARRYPRLSGITGVPTGLVGTPWGDLQVVGGAELAALVVDVWNELKLHYINVADDGAGDFVYEILVRPAPMQKQPTRIVWGHRPGHEPPCESPAADKLARLKQQAAENGSLADGDGRVIDLRYAVESPSTPRTASKP